MAIGDGLRRVTEALALRGTQINAAGRVACPAHGGDDPNLAVTQGNSGVLVFCHSHGCTADAIAVSLGLEPAALFDDWAEQADRLGKARGADGVRRTEYVYRAEDGSPRFRVVRSDFSDGRGKQFWQERYDSSSGEFVAGKDGMKGIRRVLYRLPEVRATMERGAIVYLVEGEQAADALREAFGVCTTTASGGAGKWLHKDAVPPYAESLRGAKVVLLPDADEAGEAHMRTAAEALFGVAGAIKIVRLPNLPDKGDVVEWLEAGGTLEALNGLRAQACPFAPETSADGDNNGRESREFESKRRHVPYSLRELLARPELLEPPPAIVPDIAYAGRVTLLSAREKAGKSTLTGQAAAALSTGGEFLGTHLETARVLWYPIDEPLGDTVRRFQQYGGNPDGLTIQPERPTAVEMRSEILATGAALVVIDTLAELWTGRIESDRDANEVAAFFRPYVNVARETGAAIVVLHHTTKDGAEYRGSVQLGASVDIVLTLKRPQQPTEASARGGEVEEDEDDGRRTLRGKGRGVNVNMRLHFDGALYSIGDKPMPLRARIMADLARDPASGTELSDRMHVRKETVLFELRDLTREDLVESVLKRYQLTGKGRATLQSPVTTYAASPVPTTGSRPPIETPSGTGAGTGDNRPVLSLNDSGTGPELVGNRVGTDAGTDSDGPVPERAAIGTRTGTGAHILPDSTAIGGYFTASYGEDEAA
ncbi:MAG: AAA family ATPase [Gemmatimonadaceae bacterium]